MKKQYVALFYAEDLLGEGLEHLLGKLADVEILGPWSMDDNAVFHLEDQRPDIVVIAGNDTGTDEHSGQRAGLLTAQILEKHIGLPVVQVMLEQNQVRIYNSHAVPARSADLIEAIRHPRTEDKS